MLPEVFAGLELVALLLFSFGNGRGQPSVAPVRKALPSLEAVYLKEFWVSRVDRGIGVFQHVLPPMKLRLKYSR